MQNRRTLSPVVLEVNHAYCEEPFDEENVMWISDTESLLKVFSSKGHFLPVTWSPELIDLQPFEERSTVVVQILDASCTVIRGETPEVGHEARHLTRLEVIPWACNTCIEELTEKRNIRLDCGGLHVLYVILDSCFEVKLNGENPFKYVGLVMTGAQFISLVKDSQELDETLDACICFGCIVTFGKTVQQIEANNRAIDSAHYFGFRVFDQMVQADMTVTPDPMLEQCQSSLKHAALTRSPSIVNWRQEIGDMTLRQYLRQE